jgi:hypothetical protein
MHETRKAKTSVRGSTTDVVSVKYVNFAPGLGAVSTDNIIAGGRTRKGARANDDSFNNALPVMHRRTSFFFGVLV